MDPKAHTLWISRRPVAYGPDDKPRYLPLRMTPIEATAIFGAGVAAGTINTIVGSGSLITFPTLLAFGFPPLDANVSSKIGLAPGSVSGAVGYRRELAGQRSRAIRLGISSGAGGLTGAVLLLAFPGAFAAIVPVLIAVALVLVAVGPRLSIALARYRRAESYRSLLPALLVYGTAVYGGYFGAGLGVLMFALLTLFVPDDLQRVNGLKNVLTTWTSVLAGILLILMAQVHLMAPLHVDLVLLIAVGSIVGGQVGARVGRRLPAPVLRLIILCVGLAAEAQLLIR